MQPLSGSDSSSPRPRYLLVTAGLAALLATAFVTFAPSALSPDRIGQSFAGVINPTGAPGALGPFAAFKLPIGIVAGHSGNDSGAVCDDGLTEAAVNMEVASQVRTILERQGYTIDLLEEFDPRLSGYKALALVSIHADSCEFINDVATGYKVAGSEAGTAAESSQYLTGCIRSRYLDRTHLAFHGESITRDMTGYHSFNELDAATPAAIIEIGFLYLDRDFLTRHSDLVAQGIAEGILCFTRNEPLTFDTPAP